MRTGTVRPAATQLLLLAAALASIGVVLPTAEAFRRPATRMRTPPSLMEQRRSSSFLDRCSSGAAIVLRGGEDDDESSGTEGYMTADEFETDDDDEQGVEVKTSVPMWWKLTRAIFTTTTAVVVHTVTMTARLVTSVVSSNADESSSSFWSRLFPGAARDATASDDNDSNFAEQLARTYGIDLPSADEPYDHVRGGSLASASRYAREQSRLLVVVLLPDAEAVQALLSEQVTAMCEQRARRKRGMTTASFVVWICSSSPEAKVAQRRWGLKSNSSKQPTLAVVSPIAKGGALAQHNCKPCFPGATKLSMWLDALRKRQQKDYAKLLKYNNELQIQKERKSGYVSGMQQDDDNKAQREQKIKEEKEQQRKEAAAKQAILDRRAALLNGLSEEPDASSSNCKTIALRFANGSKGQRRFDSDATSMSDIFNWVDAMFELDRESITLHTMNGKNQFEYDESDEDTLEDALGSSNRVGLRVLTKKPKNEPDAT